jgi:hypothetical protein
MGHGGIDVDHARQPNVSISSSTSFDPAGPVGIRLSRVPDELFTPTIRERPVDGKRPWRPESIFYPAFFGGPLAAATLGVLNGRRLRIPLGQVLTIGVAGLAAFAGRIVVTGLLEENSSARLAGTITGLLVWLVVLAFQRRPFRAYVYGDGEPASLTAAGFAAFLGCGLLEAIIIFAVVR